jgi:opacity protein-like surface antigen
MAHATPLSRRALLAISAAAAAGTATRAAASLAPVSPMLNCSGWSGSMTLLHAHRQAQSTACELDEEGFEGRSRRLLRY